MTSRIDRKKVFEHLKRVLLLLLVLAAHACSSTWNRCGKLFAQSRFNDENFTFNARTLPRVLVSRGGGQDVVSRAKHELAMILIDGNLAYNMLLLCSSRLGVSFRFRGRELIQLEGSSSPVALRRVINDAK
jgi:hypothetical protein